MSRNFELLAQVEQVLGVRTPDVPNAVVEQHIRPAAVSTSEVGGREEMLRLVQQLFISPNGSAPHHVVFCGVDDEKSSSAICARTARVLAAQSSRSVCLIDASGHSRFSCELFGANPRTPDIPPVTEVRDRCEKLAENLWLAPAAVLGTNHGSASVSDLRACFETLRREFDYVLVDAPPAALHSHTAVLGQAADGLVLVLEANATRRIAAKKVKETLECSNVRLLGTVLNNRTFPLPETLYRRL